MNIPKTQEERDEMLLKGLSGLEEKFETREKNSETLLKNFDQLDKTTKESVKDLELLKKNANDTALILKQIQTIQKNLRNEAVVAGLDPITRIEKNPLLRQHLNLFCRKSVNQKGEFNSQIELIQKAIGEDTGEGATLIIAQLYKEIYDTLAEYGDWSTLGVRRVGTKVTNFPVKTARPVALFLTSEATPIADDGNYAGSTITQTVLPIAVLLNVSKQLLEDAEFDVTALIMDDFQEAWNYRLDYACFLGNGGTTLDGGFTGMFNGGTGYAAAAGGVGAQLTKFDDWNKALQVVAPIVLKRKPNWWMHPQMLSRAMSVKDNNGRPIFLGSLEAPSAGAIGSILGYPVNLCMACPNTNAASSSIAAFGDRNGQVVAVRDDFTFETSDHYRWNTLERSFRAYGRAATATRRIDAFAILQTSAN